MDSTIEGNATAVDSSTELPSEDIMEVDHATPGHETSTEIAADGVDSVDPVDGGEDKKIEADADVNLSGSDLFATVAQDKILGLIGALMPPNRQVFSTYFS